MIVLQPTTHNDLNNSFNNPRSFDLSNTTSIGNFSQIPSQNTMYQTTATSQYQTQPSFVYGNPSITYTSNNPYSRTSSASSLPRQTPTDASFGLEANNSYSQLTYNNRYDQSTGTDGSKSSLQQNPSTMMPSTTAANLSPDSSNVLPPLSEVFPSSSPSSSPTQSQVQNVQVQTQQAAAAAAAAQNGFYYPDAAAAASYAAAAAAESNYGNAPNSLMSQAQQQSLGQQAQPQIATNIPTLPRIGNADLQAQMLARRESNALLAINTGLAMGASDQSPMSAGSSVSSPIVYHQNHPVAAHQALLNSHFMAAAQSMSNGMIPSSQRTMNGRKSFRSDDGDLASATGDRPPQKVYSFVALPGINTKKRPRRRYDEIERHYSCNYPGCTKSYGTLNHLNAHVQMQKHGQKRHPSEFKELRKQWRRQKREEEERKAAEAATAKNVGGLNIPSLSSAI